MTEMLGMGIDPIAAKDLSCFLSREIVCIFGILKENYFTPPIINLPQLQPTPCAKRQQPSIQLSNRRAIRFSRPGMCFG